MHMQIVMLEWGWLSYLCVTRASAAAHTWCSAQLKAKQPMQVLRESMDHASSAHRSASLSTFYSMLHKEARCGLTSSLLTPVAAAAGLKVKMSGR